MNFFSHRLTTFPPKYSGEIWNRKECEKEYLWKCSRTTYQIPCNVQTNSYISISFRQSERHIKTSRKNYYEKYWVQTQTLIKIFRSYTIRRSEKSSVAHYALEKQNSIDKNCLDLVRYKYESLEITLSPFLWIQIMVRYFFAGYKLCWIKPNWIGI